MSIIDDWRSAGFQWDRRLNFTGGAGAVIYDVNVAGEKVGDGHLVALPSPDDPKWCPRGEDRERYLGELAPAHLAALYSFLMRRAWSIHTQVLCAWASSPLWGDGPQGGWDDLDADDPFAEARAWLADTRFVRCLETLLLGAGYRALIEHWHGAPGPWSRSLVEQPEWWDE